MKLVRESFDVVSVRKLSRDIIIRLLFHNKNFPYQRKIQSLFDFIFIAVTFPAVLYIWALQLFIVHSADGAVILRRSYFNKKGTSKTDLIKFFHNMQYGSMVNFSLLMRFNG